MTTMPRKGVQDRHRGAHAPTVVGSGVDSAQGKSAPYGICCGHDLSRHRGGRCWTGSMGEPLFRTRSLIACNCDGLVAS